MKTLLLTTAMALVSFSAAQAAYVVPVSGTVNGKAVTGTFTVKQFSNINNTLNAVGTLTLGTSSTSVAIPVAGSAAAPTSGAGQAATSCPILNLTLGPLDLNLLGLTVHLNQVVLNIAAVPGAGNLLGNLLCDVANLLNGGGALSDIVNTLNTILASL